MGISARIEHQKIRERTTRGRRAKVEAGKLVGGSCDLYGYRKNKEKPGRVIYEPEAAIVRSIFRWVGEEGQSIRSVVQRLNDSGVAAPSEGKRNLGRTAYWGQGCLRRILINEAYKGETTRNEARPYYLRGLVGCRVCGRKMRATPEKKGLRTYRCSSRETPSGPCGGKRVNAELLEEFVWERVAEVLQDPTVILDARNRAREQGPNLILQADLESAQRALAKVEKEQQRLVRLFAESEDRGTQAIGKGLADEERERQRLQSSITDLQRLMTQQEKDDESWEALSAYCDEVADQIDNFTFEDKRKALERLGLTVRASGRRWSIRFVLPGWECEPFEVEERG